MFASSNEQICIHTRILPSCPNLGLRLVIVLSLAFLIFKSEIHLFNISYMELFNY